MNNKLKITALAFLLWTLPAGAAQARESSLLTPPSPSRQVAFIFHKMAGLAPDFDQAVRADESYKNAEPAKRPDILAQETRRLAVEYANTDPRKDIIVARSSVELDVNTTTRPGLTITLPRIPGSPVYFPYQWGGHSFAVIPDEFDLFLNLPMAAIEASAASARIGGKTATMVIEMKPLKADASRPMMMDGERQWLLMTKIVAVTFYNQYLETIWSWHAPEFKRESSTLLKSLKR